MGQQAVPQRQGRGSWPAGCPLGQLGRHLEACPCQLEHGACQWGMGHWHMSIGHTSQYGMLHWVTHKISDTCFKVFHSGTRTRLRHNVQHLKLTEPVELILDNTSVNMTSISQTYSGYSPNTRYSYLTCSPSEPHKSPNCGTMKCCYNRCHLWRQRNAQNALPHHHRNHNQWWNSPPGAAPSSSSRTPIMYTPAEYITYLAPNYSINCTYFCTYTHYMGVLLSSANLSMLTPGTPPIPHLHEPSHHHTNAPPGYDTSCNGIGVSTIWRHHPTWCQHHHCQLPTTTRHRLKRDDENNQGQYLHLITFFYIILNFISSELFLFSYPHSLALVFNFSLYTITPELRKA